MIALLSLSSGVCRCCLRIQSRTFANLPPVYLLCMLGVNFKLHLHAQVLVKSSMSVCCSESPLTYSFIGAPCRVLLQMISTRPSDAQ